MKPLVLFTTLALMTLAEMSFAGDAKPLVTAAVRASNENATLSADGVIEAIRHTVIAPQVSGAIVQLPVQAGDSVKAGQLLVRLDARAAQQEFTASKAQVDAARANLAVAEKDYERQKLLFEKNYISQATLDRAQAQFKSAAAQANAQIAQANAVQTQSGFYSITAPYNGIVAEMPSALGEMAMPGRSIMTVYDPSSLRAIFTVSQAKVAALKLGKDLTIEIPSMPPEQRFIASKNVTVLPLSDANTHTVQLRLELPTNVRGVQPGMFARIALSFNAASTNSNPSVLGDSRLYVPRTAVIRRAEMYAVYVVNAQGKAVLRQIKPGRIQDTEQEILSGVAKGELVAIDPLAASLSTAK
ncbi:efflux RND transporter periplasmic adaptor subunit [Undibacterium sp. FT137W]|uniref:Efflux RND transporter periplasmic adaptor subunit n=2 Tax=Undibacterium fentianense TaxID=2828728 RepID=A0A941E2U7_9BURK|nr:efflux RND transporter periplasmic adaptor subunit [Undibacterium fentianense]